MTVIRLWSSISPWSLYYWVCGSSTVSTVSQSVFFKDFLISVMVTPQITPDPSRWRQLGSLSSLMTSSTADISGNQLHYPRKSVEISCITLGNQLKSVALPWEIGWNQLHYPGKSVEINCIALGNQLKSVALPWEISKSVALPWEISWNQLDDFMIILDDFMIIFDTIDMIFALIGNDVIWYMKWVKWRHQDTKIPEISW